MEPTSEKHGIATDSDMDGPTVAGSSTSLSEKGRPDSREDAPVAVVDGEKLDEIQVQVTAPPTGDKSTAAPGATGEDNYEYPTGFKLTMITVALVLAVLLIALDNAIIATAIPKISDQFNSLADVGWYGSAYLLTTAACQLLLGKFYTFFNVKWTFLTAIAIFELGSLICGVAQNSNTLIIGRAIAGIGSAGLFSGGLIILAHAVPLAKRPMYTGFVGSTYGIAQVVGPLLGGAFTDRATWRWCFLINLPIGAVTIAVIALFYKDHDLGSVHGQEPTSWRERVMRFDPFGTLAFVPAIVSLLLALQWGGTKYAWSEWRIILLFVLFGVLIIAFVVIQWFMQENATVPPRIFLQRTVWSSCLFVFCLGAGFLSTVYYLPIWFQAVKGASAIDSGVMNLPMLISFIISSVLGGVLVTAIGYYTPFMILSTILMPIGYGLLATLQPDTGKGMWIGYQILAGFGVGIGQQQCLIAVQTVLATSDIPVGTSLSVFAQTLGGALFVGIGQNVFTNRLAEYVEDYVPGLDPMVVLGTGATQIQEDIPKEQLAGVTLAYNDALAKVFVVITAIAAASIIGLIFVEWKSVKAPNKQAVAREAGEEEVEA